MRGARGDQGAGLTVRLAETASGLQSAKHVVSRVSAFCHFVGAPTLASSLLDAAMPTPPLAARLPARMRAGYTRE
jgi:hypothetical protein